MNEGQLRQILQCVNVHLGAGKYTTGVYASDRLPRRFKKPAAFIANTDTHDEAGTHWVAFFIPARGKPEYFDSYGLDTFIKGHLNFQSQINKVWHYNKKEFQGVMSNVCGHYCLAFLIGRIKGYTMRKFQTLFKNNTKRNDERVRTYINEFYIKNCETRCNKFGQVCCARVK